MKKTTTKEQIKKLTEHYSNMGKAWDAIVNQHKELASLLNPTKKKARAALSEQQGEK